MIQSVRRGVNERGSPLPNRPLWRVVKACLALGAPDQPSAAGTPRRPRISARPGPAAIVVNTHISTQAT